jgi:hypothetical protein
MPRQFFTLMLLACLSGLFATTKNLIREDMFVRTGFEKAWLKIWPERTKGSGDWHHVPSSPGDNRPRKNRIVRGTFCGTQYLSLAVRENS